MSAALIQWSNVRKRFWKGGAPFEALGGVTLDVNDGEFLAIVGPSGCGKSTLLNMTAGLMRPSGGSVAYGHLPVTAVNTRVGYLTQKDGLLPWLSVQDNVGLALEVRRVPAPERQATVARLIELVGLQGFERHYPHELSGGMRKRAAMARTLVYEPETLLMDEPFGALDAQLKLILQDELLRIWQTSRKTVVFVTHDLDEAVTLADRVVVISARPGTIKAVIPIDLPRPRDVFTVRRNARFGELFDAVWEALADDVRRGESL